MKLGPEEYPLIGSQGTALVVYKLRRLGIPAMEAGEGMPFDVVAFPGDRVIRIQCKATQSLDHRRKAFRFATHKGRWAKDMTNSKPMTAYLPHEVDFIAMIALPIEAVMFRPAKDVGKQTQISLSKLQAPNVEMTSWRAAIESIK